MWTIGLRDCLFKGFKPPNMFLTIVNVAKLVILSFFSLIFHKDELAFFLVGSERVEVKAHICWSVLTG